MLKYRFLLIFLCWMGQCSIGFAQTDASSAEVRECTRNIQSWLRMLDGKPSPGLMEDLGDCYVKLGDHESAVHWYGRSLQVGNSHADCQRKYALSLRAIGRYEDAIGAMHAYGAAAGDGATSAIFEQECRALMAQRMQQGKFEVERIAQLSSSQNEVPACRHEDDLYFYSRSPRRRLGKLSGAGASPRPFRLYSVPANQWGQKRNIRMVARMEFPAESDLGLVWDHTCKDYYVVKTERNSAGNYSAPAIYRSWIDLHGLVHEEKLALNMDVAFSNFHPAISPDGRWLVFVSNRPGGYGETDLYAAYRSSNFWSDPVNLGPLVNSPGTESYPAFSASGRLYFSSDVSGGFGKFDVYYTDLEKGEWSAAVNVGAAVNSAEDDFGLVWNTDKEFSTGYFSSSRSGSGKCDLYAFQRHPEIVGRVTDGQTGKALPQAQLYVYAQGASRTRVPVGQGGEYASFLDLEQKYYVEVALPGYESNTWEFDAREIPQGSDMEFDIALVPMHNFTLQGRLLDRKTGAPLDHVSLRVLNGRTGEELHYDGSLGGTYTVSLERGVDYALLFQKDGYQSVAMPLKLESLSKDKVAERNVEMVEGNKVLLVGLVTDAKGNALLGQSRIDLVDAKTKAVVQRVDSDAEGHFSLLVDRNMVGKYSLFASHAGVASSHVRILADDDQYFPFQLSEMPLGLTFASRELQHDYGQKEVNETSRELVDDLYFFLLANPDVGMELRTFADARGSAAANAALSEQRSRAIINDLLVRGGIAPERLRFAAYGESRPRNECVDGVDCPEDKHAANRRTEVFFFALPQAAAHQ